MFKKLSISLLAAAFCFALAQGPEVSPTVGNGPDQFDAGAPSASVDQNVNLILPPTVALHLDVSELDFDMERIGDDDAPFVCVYGAGFRGDDSNGGTFNSQVQWLPLGTSYGVASEWTASQDPIIEILNAGEVVNTYPPILLDDDGELIEGSKNYFVCYQTFILQKFSNYSDWNLSVERSGDGAFDMYIQDNSICSFNAGMPTGFFRILDGQTVDLLPSNLTDDTTGNLSATCGHAGTSWLDDLVVVAVKVNGDTHGTNTATLTYTISGEVPAAAAN